MKKGISPIVSSVLLIGIAVVAAAGVWFFTSPLVSQNSLKSNPGSYIVRISNCRIQGNTVSVFVRNIGTSNTKSTHNVSAYFVDNDNYTGRVNLKSLVSGGYYLELKFK